MGGPAGAGTGTRASQRVRSADEPGESAATTVARYPAGTSVVVPPEFDPGHVYHLFVIRVPAADRDRILKTLQSRGVGAGIARPASRRSTV